MKTNKWYPLTLKLFNEMCFMSCDKAYSIVIYDIEKKDVMHANYFVADKDSKDMNRLTFVVEYDLQYFMRLYSLVMSYDKNFKDGLMTYKELQDEMNKKLPAYITIVMEEESTK